MSDQVSTPPKRVRWRANRVLALGLLGVLALYAAGCAPPMRVVSQTSSQLNTIGKVSLNTTYCTTDANNGAACAAYSAGNNSSITVKLGYSIPNAASAPASFNTTSGPALTFTQDPSYTPSQAGVTVAPGNKWVGYSSQAYTYDGTSQTAAVAPQFGLAQGADGTPFTGGFPYSVTVQTQDSQGFGGAATSSGNQATRDLGVKHTNASVAAGRTATVPFNLQYAGAAGAGPFTVSASTDVSGAAAAPSITSLTPAANSDNNITVSVPVPASAAPGTRHVTVTAKLANGQTRTGTANLTVTEFVPQVKQIAAGFDHTCAILHNGTVRCWGIGNNGQLGQGNTNNIGLTAGTLPDSVPPVNLGAGRTALQISAGIDHTCALLDNHGVLCWGAGAAGGLGQGSQDNIGDDETPGSVGPVDLGGNHTAVAVAAGGNDSCAVLDDGSVKCWGSNYRGQLGYGNTSNVFSPSSVGAVDLGPGRTAVAVDAAADHTCVILANGGVMCWGGNTTGKLGYGYNETVNQNIGDNETPASVGLVNLGGHTALQITGGDNNTCALYDDHTLHCWGTSYRGINGYGSQNDFYAPQTQPDDFGAHTVLAVEGGADHTCVILDDHTLRCWGFGDDGRLGYGNTSDVGDNEAPGAAGPVNIGAGRTAVAVSAGRYHSCALMDSGDVRCWGFGSFLGYGNTTTIGDDETPNVAGPVSLGD